MWNPLSVLLKNFLEATLQSRAEAKADTERGAVVRYLFALVLIYMASVSLIGAAVYRTGEIFAVLTRPPEDSEIPIIGEGPSVFVDHGIDDRAVRETFPSANVITRTSLGKHREAGGEALLKTLRKNHCRIILTTDLNLKEALKAQAEEATVSGPALSGGAAGRVSSVSEKIAGLQIIELTGDGLSDPKALRDELAAIKDDVLGQLEATAFDDSRIFAGLPREVLTDAQRDAKAFDVAAGQISEETGLAVSLVVSFFTPLEQHKRARAIQLIRENLRVGGLVESNLQSTLDAMQSRKQYIDESIAILGSARDRIASLKNIIDEHILSNGELKNPAIRQHWDQLVRAEPGANLYVSSESTEWLRDKIRVQGAIRRSDLLVFVADYRSKVDALRAIREADGAIQEFLSRLTPSLKDKMFAPREWGQLLAIQGILSQAYLLGTLPHPEHGFEMPISRELIGPLVYQKVGVFAPYTLRGMDVTTIESEYGATAEELERLIGVRPVTTGGDPFGQFALKAERPLGPRAWPQDSNVEAALRTKLMPIPVLVKGNASSSEAQQALIDLSRAWLPIIRAAWENGEGKPFELPGLYGKWVATENALARVTQGSALYITDQTLVAAVQGTKNSGLLADIVAPRRYVGGSVISLDGLTTGKWYVVQRAATISNAAAQLDSWLELLEREWPGTLADQERVLSTLVVLRPGPKNFGKYPTASRRQVLTALDQIKARWRDELAVHWCRHWGVPFTLTGIEGEWRIVDDGTSLQPPDGLVLKSDEVLRPIWPSAHRNAGHDPRDTIQMVSPVRATIPGIRGEWLLACKYEERNGKDVQRFTATCVDPNWPAEEDEIDEGGEPVREAEPKGGRNVDNDGRETSVENRQWTITGKGVFFGYLVSTDGSEVILEAPGGERRTQFVMNLSQKDQDYLKTVPRNKSAPDASPGSSTEKSRRKSPSRESRNQKEAVDLIFGPGR